jgi:hypothetical protein
LCPCCGLGPGHRGGHRRRTGALAGHSYSVHRLAARVGCPSGDDRPSASYSARPEGGHVGGHRVRRHRGEPGLLVREGELDLKPHRRRRLRGNSVLDTYLGIACGVSMNMAHGVPRSLAAFSVGHCVVSSRRHLDPCSAGHPYRSDLVLLCAEHDAGISGSWRHVTNSGHGRRGQRSRRHWRQPDIPAIIEEHIGCALKHQPEPPAGITALNYYSTTSSRKAPVSAVRHQTRTRSAPDRIIAGQGLFLLVVAGVGFEPT